jgi:hypothetical protein
MSDGKNLQPIIFLTQLPCFVTHTRERDEKILPNHIPAQVGEVLRKVNARHAPIITRHHHKHKQ